MYQSRFKHFLIPHEFLAEESAYLQRILAPYSSAYADGKISDSEWVFSLIAEILERRRPGGWWMKSASPLPFKGTESAKTFFSTCGLFQKLKLESPEDFFRKYKLKRLPGAIQNILSRWSLQEVLLFLEEEPVRPEEMLEFQARGERVVTVAKKALFAGTLVDGRRDALEFLLHDLVHADLFFSHAYEEQVSFFKILSQKHHEFLEDARCDAVFCKDLDYVMSDMNTTGAHLRQSLRAAVVEKERRKECLPAKTPLSAIGEAICEKQLLPFAESSSPPQA
jgi:hypothetical protein